MELAAIAARQVFQMLLMMLTGVVCCKSDAFKPEERRILSNLLMYLVMPATVINSYLAEFDPQTFRNLLCAFGMSAIAVAVALFIASAVASRMPGKDRAILRFASAFPNAAYMGFPLIRAMFGDEGLLYASGFVTVFNILLWTVGYVSVSGKAKPREILHSVITCPCIIAVALGLVIYLCRIPVPDIIAGPIEAFGNMNTPLSMLITGMTIAGSDLGRLAHSKSLLSTLALRLVVIPAAELALFAVLGFTGMVPIVVLILEACPCVTITTVFAIQFGHDEDLAAGAVVFSTLCSVVTLPIYVLALTAVL